MEHISMLLGGLALFLYGMNEMGKGLELLAGNKLQEVLEKLTSNKYIGILVGALVTSIIQSSSATTVMTVGFVNSRILSLSQAIYVIMGANIGTTITGLILTLDIDLIAPFFTFIGMIMMLFTKKRKYKYSGTIIFGFGVLFMGMNMMGAAVKPLAANREFTSLLAKSSNPLIGIVVGAIFTAVVQSSSATTGILITFANTGIITFESAFYLILGTNIGTCITSVLSSIGANKNAKRVAVAHITFNVIGTIIFTAASLSLPVVNWIEALSHRTAEQIAYLHTIFNLVTTILLIPFTDLLVDISKNVIKGSDEKEKGLSLMYLNPEGYHDTIPTIAGIRQESLRMLKYTQENLKLSIQDLLNHEDDTTANIEFNEEIIDYLNKEITKVSVKTMTNDLNKYQYKQLSYYLKIASNIERLGDYAYNISKLASRMYVSEIKFSSETKLEIIAVSHVLEKLYDDVFESLKENDFDMKEIRTKSFIVQDMVERNRENSLHRLRNGSDDAETGLVYDKFYTYILRTRDHLINVSNQYATIYE
ncbi:Na/Pi cotransporter family protein [Helcococcus kunzii]|uniref:Na/Pi cotransporter family protein n=2 Tax=Helcococcus kunzii TaxID=40091 RepID=UPI001BB0CA10|nr:Na/Pi cotransporter family protein [Helcococcus kunzii]QUY64967.1 Na/Pi cotransporter family protein [Helcococcus kunzii]QZO75674.1 Na/Pi cotransporter family protein [Helcococcus kunzii]